MPKAIRFPPGMPDRLKELQRQRALVQDHIAWLDGEIAREAQVAPVPVAPGEPAGPALAPAPVAAAIPAPMSADDILARYSQDKAGGMAKDAKRGCMIWFAFLMVSMALFVMTAYFLYIHAKR